MRIWSFALLLCILNGCSGLLYFPSRNLLHNPASIGLKPEEVFFPSKNGNKLFGWFFHNKKNVEPKAILVFFHGNAENLSSHYLNLAWLVDYPYDFFIFDYQGYGRSEGDPSPQKTVEDGIAALELMHARHPQTPLVIFGQSLGGAIALRTAVETKNTLPIKMVAVDSTFPSYRSMGRKVLSRSWLTWPLQWMGWLFLSDAYAPDGLIGNISPIPLLVIHGTQDKTVEFEMGERVFAQAKDPKDFWPIKAGGHTDIFSIQDVSYKIRFIDALNKAVRK